MEADACGVCNGGNSTSTLVTDSASGVLPIVGNNFTLSFVPYYIY